MSKYFDTIVVAQKPDGMMIEKVCNGKHADEWAYLFKTWGWKVIEVKLTAPTRGINKKK